MMDCTPYRRRGFLVPNIPSVPETPVFYTECLRKRVAYTRSPSTVPNATSAKRRKTLPAPNFSNCQKREGHCKKRSPECRREQEITAKKFAMTPKATQCHSEKPRYPKATQCPQKVDITPLSKSKKPISELTGFLVVGRRIELLLRD